MAQRYRTNCRAELPEDAPFCTKCGRPAPETASVSIRGACIPILPPSRLRKDLVSRLLLILMLTVGLVLTACWC